MSKNLQSPTKLTEFAPLQEEEKPQGVSQFISKLFKINRAEETSLGHNNAESSASIQQQPDTIINSECSSNSSIPNIYLVDLNEGRSLPNVLKRISNLLALKSNNLQDYADTELKQYWMPDAVSKECYECSEKFTTFRRKHHCRVCGQIFCSQCCNQQIPGKIFGCTGDLRVCTYCCKVVLSYLQSSNNFGASLSVDLKDLQESLQNKFGGECSSVFETSPSTSVNLKLSSESNNEIQRKISVGYQEEKFIGSECNSVAYLTNEEKSRALQNSLSLRNLYEEICKSTTGLNFTPYKYRLKTYPDSFLGSELVDWLICQQKANNRIQAAALAQALLEGNYIESFTEIRNFVDGYLRYRKGTFKSARFTEISPNFDYPGEKEHSSSWINPHESSNTDSDNEQLSASPPVTQTGLISSSTSFTLNLNVEANSAYLSRPPESPDLHYSHQHEETVVRPSEQRELAPESGWFQASALREENGEKEAFELLSEAYEQHEQSLLKQLLSAKNLPSSWSDILIPLTRDVVSTIRPDKNHDAIQLDIRNYVQIKKLPTFNKNDTYLVNGVVFSKNVAHKEMSPALENPKILLLECSIVYQRTEGRLMSLEPVLMQEHEYLRHVVARIAALQPNVVLIQRNISRLAQDMLRKYNITLVHNVKRSVLERLARCTEADIVQSVDAHIGRPKLGSCKRFYLKNFLVENTRKTLMFFEGLPRPYLGATILLGGAFKHELIKVKKVAQFLIFTAYNWRLEKSFLMDEFALPPNSRMEFLDDISSKENSPQNENGKPLILIEKKVFLPEKEPYFDPLQSEPKKIHVESVDDQSDPLQSELNILKGYNQEILTVSELGISNNFKKYLEDTILCISPYVIFPMPYLESDAGKKCKLRQFFYKDNYFSEQFMESFSNTTKRKNLIIEELHKQEENNKLPELLLHSFLTAKITITHDNSLQNRLALFRACGSRFPKKEILEIKQLLDQSEEKSSSVLINSQLDVLDTQNHQKLAVLFYSFSHESNNAPAFCVTPWVVWMDFYGKNDIPLGCFLERYCFRSTYSCPSKSCITPMVKHIRRFVHNSGSITISLNNFENEYAEENIVMWSWCTKCTSVSPVVPLSVDSWSYSFAKYLELLFHGDIFNRRGLNPCRHSLHQDHYHYFGYKSYVASFKYTPINLWEISLPPFIIETDYNMDNLHENLIEEAKFLAQKSHDLFALVLDRVLAVASSSSDEELLENVGNVRQIINKEQTNFKQKLEHIQIKLTSPTVEFKEFDMKIVKEAYWKIQESIGKLKGTLTEFVDTWNNHLSESIRKSDKKKEKNQILDAAASETPTTIEENEENFLYHEETTHLDESSSEKREIKKENTVKNLLDKLLPSSTSQNLIPSPFSLQEHYNLSAGVYGTIPVFENEFSSIIAYALNSFEYKKSLEELISRKTQFFDSPLLSKRKNPEEDENKTSTSSGLLGFLRNESNSISESDQSSAIQTPTTVEEKNPKNSYIEIEFKDPINCAFFCRIYCAESFANLRLTVLEKTGGEETFIHSLSRCIQWKAIGGKSGSSFFKTLDDRYILKGMSRPEVHMFMESSANYFAYMQKCSSTKQPTLLGKIVGIYQIRYNNSALSLAHRMYLLVMENLFYKRNVSQKFDLKGSMRNRLVIPDNREGDIVLQDENLSKMICENPLYVYPHSKEVFLAAIQNDTEFLSTQSVMDYSLLVGLDTKNKELVLGIIDYIRTFTLDKKLETMVKRSGILGGQGKLPTIVSPEEYQKRFIEAMHRYFLEVPDHFSGLAKGLLDI